MKIVVYDATIEGFLTMIYQSYYQKIIPDLIRKEPFMPSLLEEVIDIYTDEFQAQKVLASMKERFLSKHFQRILHIFLCEGREFEMDLYRYIVFGFKNPKYMDDINYPFVYELEKLEHELFRIVHRMYGFIRFEELEDRTLYAKIETKFNILPLIGKHFCKRLDTFDFIIHDVKREMALVKLDMKSQIHKVSDFDTPIYSQNEEKFQKLWKLFFEQVSIKERKNKKLQQNWIPLLYRKYMTEFG